MANKQILLTYTIFFIYEFIDYNSTYLINNIFCMGRYADGRSMSFGTFKVCMEKDCRNLKVTNHQILLI